jgi:Prokaryotic Cytochrome C oxidase subunit IV
MTGAREWPVWLVWSMLASASLAGFWLAEGHASARTAASAAIVLAALKINLVFEQYMDLRWHHRPLRLLLAGWLTLVTTILLGGLWLA